MKKVILILFIATGCSKVNQECLHTFNSELGTEKSQVLSEMVRRFEIILENYNGSSINMKYQSFLNTISEGNHEVSEFDLYDRSELREMVRRVGLDTAIFEYRQYQNRQGETIKYIEQISTGSFINSMRRVRNCHSFFEGYINSIEEIGTISPPLVAEGMLNNLEDSDYNAL